MCRPEDFPPYDNGLTPDNLTKTQRVMVRNPESSFYGMCGWVRWQSDRTYGVSFTPIGGPAVAFGRDELVIAPSGGR
jgi:hypothetical protein